MSTEQVPIGPLNAEKIEEEVFLYMFWCPSPVGGRCLVPVPSLLPTGERVDLFTYPPVCLPSQEDDFEGKGASVYGE